MSQFIARTRKAITAGLGAGVAVAVAAVQSHGSLTESDYATIVGTVLVVGFLAWLVPNAPAAAPAALPASAAPPAP